MPEGQFTREGRKEDTGKARYELLPYEVIDAVAKILTDGARKYDSRNWEKGISYGRVYGAAQRHLTEFWNQFLKGGDGINHADGSQLHIDHAITELMFLSAYIKRGITQFDDRPGKIEEKKFDLRQG